VRPTPRLLIIGIDGGTFDIIDPLIARGMLPTLASFLRTSAHGASTTTWPAHTAPGWSSFISACHPGGHGIYQFYGTAHPAYGAAITRAPEIGRSSVWDWLAAQDHTLGLINIPMSHPPAGLPGYQITWPLEKALRFSHPPTLLHELSAAKAHFQPDLATMFRGDLAYLEEAEANVEARVRSIRHLMTTRPVDVVMAVLTETDRVAHHYWHFGDPTHPQHRTPPVGSGWEEAVARIYRAVDRAIGELLSLVSPDTHVMLVSDHGSGQGRHSLGIHTLLEEAGLLATESGSAPQDSAASWFADGGRRVDFSRTAVYMPVPGSYGLTINMRGRQASGVVAPRDWGRVENEVVDLLGALRTPEGGKVFREILPAAHAYPGPFEDKAPDLLLIPQDEGVLPVGELSGGVWRPSAQTGLHRHEGMWAYRSPRTAPGRRAEPVPLVDLIPSALSDLGADWPEDVHGRARLELFSETVARPAPDPRVRGSAAGATPVPEPVAAGAESEDTYTSDRLREMGYL
jgi:predicted AlkP superfamily phosphohydrolase/phosphomutase